MEDPMRSVKADLTMRLVKDVCASEAQKKDVWGFVITTDPGSILDSRWGFYGPDAASEAGMLRLTELAKTRHVTNRVMTDEERVEYVRKLVQQCYDDHNFLVEVVEAYAADHTYEDYLLECGGKEKSNGS